MEKFKDFHLFDIKQVTIPNLTSVWHQYGHHHNQHLRLSGNCITFSEERQLNELGCKALATPYDPAHRADRNW